ncbi:hypothetical protein PMAYCL1PPCAC_22057, partial [Pristionchus mayeri]
TVGRALSLSSLGPPAALQYPGMHLLSVLFIAVVFLPLATTLTCKSPVGGSDSNCDEGVKFCRRIYAGSHYYGCDRNNECKEEGCFAIDAEASMCCCEEKNNEGTCTPPPFDYDKVYKQRKAAGM